MSRGGFGSASVFKTGLGKQCVWRRWVKWCVRGRCGKRVCMEEVGEVVCSGEVWEASVYGGGG